MNYLQTFIRKNRTYIIAFVLLLLITGCTAGGERFTADNPATFWMGLWHGIIAVFAFIISLFNQSVTIYEINNTGAWYNFGFLLGLIAVWGGGSCSTACKKKKTPEETLKEQEWKQVEQKVEAKLKRKIREWVDSDEDEDWDEVGKKLEDKIKEKIKNWAEEE
jgi:hypothetical protein